MKKIQKKKNSNYRRVFIIGIIIVLGVLSIGCAIYTGIFLPWKDVYFKIEENRVTYDEINYQVYLAAKTLNAPLPDLSSTNPQVLASSRAVLQLAYVYAMSDAILYNKAVKAHLTVSNEEVEAYINNLKKSISSELNYKTETMEDFLNSIGVRKNKLETIVHKKLLAEKEKDRLTENIIVTREEVYSFYNEFSNAYVKNEKEKDTYLKENYAKVESDALKNKKEHYVMSTLRNTLIKDEIQKIEIDNPYKKLMRFWYGTFLGTEIPEIYKAKTPQDLLQ